MMITIQSTCNKEIKRLNKNVRLILNKSNITNEDLQDLNSYYNDLDFYNYHKNFNRLQRALLEEYDE